MLFVALDETDAFNVQGTNVKCEKNVGESAKKIRISLVWKVFFCLILKMRSRNENSLKVIIKVNPTKESEISWKLLLKILR